MSPRTFFSKRALSQRYNVHEATLDRWVREKRFPRPLKLGGQKGTCRWPSDVIEQYEAESANTTHVAA
jgi:predicted DNA-binding transcriptional regulator AlpA